MKQLEELLIEELWTLGDSSPPSPWLRPLSKQEKFRQAISSLQEGDWDKALTSIVEVYQDKPLAELKKDAEEITETFKEHLKPDIFFKTLLQKEEQELSDFLKNRKIHYIIKLFLTMAMAAEEKKQTVSLDVIISALEVVAEKYVVSGWLCRLYYEKTKQLKDPIEKLNALRKAVDILPKILAQVEERELNMQEQMKVLVPRPVLTPNVQKYMMALVSTIEKIREKLGEKSESWTEAWTAALSETANHMTVITAKYVLVEASNLLEKLCKEQEKSKQNIRYISKNSEILKAPKIESIPKKTGEDEISIKIVGPR